MKFFLLFIIIYLFNCSSNNNIENQDNQETSVNPDSSVDEDNTINFNPIFKEFNEEWERTMQTFVSQYMYSIQVKYKSQVEYYENITKTPDP